MREDGSEREGRYGGETGGREGKLQSGCNVQEKKMFFHISSGKVTDMQISSLS